MLLLTACGGPPEPAAPPPPAVDSGVVVALPDAAPTIASVEATAPDPPTPLVEKAGSEPVGKDATAIAWTDEPFACAPRAVTFVRSKKTLALGAGETIAWCGNQCVVVASKKKNERLDVATGGRTTLAIPPLPDPTTLSMSADCALAAFRVPSNTIDTYETWDVATGKKIRTSKAWQVAGGAFDAELVPSGKFLEWRYSRGADVYDETKSGVKGPGIGLNTTMSPDDRFIFIGGGMTFGTDKDTPAELMLSKNGSRIYSVPKKAGERLTGAFCPSSKLLATMGEKSVVLRSTDDPKPVETLPIHATAIVFSPKGDQFAAFDADAKVVHIYRLRGNVCAP